MQNNNRSCFGEKNIFFRQKQVQLSFSLILMPIFLIGFLLLLRRHYVIKKT